MALTLPVPSPPALYYRKRARLVAESVRDAWERSSHVDIKSLVDEVQCALTMEANHELRQVLFLLSAQLELALVKTRTSESIWEAESIERLLQATQRATAIVDAYLDRGEVAKMVIPLSRSRFDLGEALSDLLHWRGLTGGSHVVIEPVEVIADRDRLLAVLEHMVASFASAPGSEHRLHVVLRNEEDHVDGFIGLEGADLSAGALLDAFDVPFQAEAIELDMPYARAVIERHGGTLFVATDRDGADGYAFILPFYPPEEA